VTYFQMPQTIRTTDEYFTLQSPAYFHNLLSDVVEEHPFNSTVIPTMMIFVDGLPAQLGMY